MRAIVVRQAKAKKLTAYALARKTGVTEPTVRNFLDGTHEMRSDKLALLMAALDLHIVTGAELARLKDFEFRYKSVSD